LSISSRAARAPSASTSKNTGVKKMPNVTSTWTMYFTSRKNRFAQLVTSAVATVNDTSSASITGTQRSAADGVTPNARASTATAASPAARSTRCASTLATGSTSRGKLTFVSSVAFDVRLPVPNVTAPEKNAHGTAFTAIDAIVVRETPCPAELSSATRIITPASTTSTGVSSAQSTPSTACL
jgi:hypothetical protein